MQATYNGYQPYWLYEGPGKASQQRAQALIDAGINVRAIVWLRSAEAGTARLGAELQPVHHAITAQRVPRTVHARQNMSQSCPA
jgi:hypothetical protein